MLRIIGIAMAGPQADYIKTSSTVPVMVLLSGLGGWSDAKTEAKTVTPSAPQVISSETETTGEGQAGDVDWTAREEQALEELLSGRPRGDPGGLQQRAAIHSL